MRPRMLLVAAGVLVLAGIGLVGARPANADTGQDYNPPRIVVRGQATVFAPPDIATLSLGASVRRDSSDAAYSQANTLVGQLTAFLREQGIAERDIQTRQFTLNPEYGRAQGDAPPPIVGWRAVNTVSIKVRDFARLSAIIDGAARILGNDAQISGISFSIENTDVLASRARTDAIRSARVRAEEMAIAAGVRLGRVLSISETSAPPPTPFRAAAPAPAALAAAPVAEVSTGEQGITVTVEMVFEIG
jgi:uncharacterized protein